MKHEEFLRQVALGDREAFHQLYLETGRSVYSFILSILKNPQDAEEVLQEGRTEKTTNKKLREEKWREIRRR
mgnify:CR=1 FL=1